VADVDLPAGPGFAFVAGEAGCVRPVRRHLRAVGGLARERVDVDGYWRRGVVNHDHHTPGGEDD
jgi:NADPH-dependent ferric siderophore reductase